MCDGCSLVPNRYIFFHCCSFMYEISLLLGISKFNIPPPRLKCIVPLLDCPTMASFMEYCCTNIMSWHKMFLLKWMKQAARFSSLACPILFSISYKSTLPFWRRTQQTSARFTFPPAATYHSTYLFKHFCILSSDVQVGLKRSIKQSAAINPNFFFLGSTQSWLLVTLKGF